MAFILYIQNTTDNKPTLISRSSSSESLGCLLNLSRQ